MLVQLPLSASACRAAIIRVVTGVLNHRETPALARPAAPPEHTTVSVSNDLIPKAGHNVDRIIGELRSRYGGLADQTVYLASRTACERFVLSDSATTGPGGNVSFTVTPTTLTQYELVYQGDASHQPSRSAVIALKAATDRV